MLSLYKSMHSKSLLFCANCKTKPLNEIFKFRFNRKKTEFTSAFRMSLLR